MKKEKYLLFCDDVCEYIDANKNDIINDLIFNGYDEPTESDVFAWACDDIQRACDDLKNSINAYDNIYLDNAPVVVVASLGLWYGRKRAQKTFRGLYHALFLSNIFEDTNALYFERKNTTLTLKAIHHDGVNYFKFYALKNGKKYAIKLDDLMRTL